MAVCPLARQSARACHSNLASSPHKSALSWLCDVSGRAERAKLVARLERSQHHSLRSGASVDLSRALKDQTTIASYLGLVQRTSRIAVRTRMGLSSSTMPSSYDPQTLVRDKLALRDTVVVVSCAGIVASTSTPSTPRLLRRLRAEPLPHRYSPKRTDPTRRTRCACCARFVACAST